MKYTIEKIYAFSGQFDKIVSVTFKNGSKARENFGDFLTGEFFYTKDDRILLEQKIKEIPMPSTDGYVRFDVSPGEVTDEKKNDLYEIGFLSSDVSSIMQFKDLEENKFMKSDLKKLPEPIKIEFDFSDWDSDASTLWLIQMRVDNGSKLIPNEVAQHNAVILKRNGYDKCVADNPEIFIDPVTGNIYEDIKYHYLHGKFMQDDVTKAEDAEYKTLLDKRITKRTEIIGNEIKQSSGNLKQLGLQFGKVIKQLVIFSAHFEDKRLTNSKFPVWLDFERFIHIYLRHVKELQIGERFTIKTPFQYGPSDIERLIEHVLRLIDDEIQRHFAAKPGKDFKRHGTMAVYYNGDYYNLHIGNDGRLLAFYKQGTIRN